MLHRIGSVQTGNGRKGGEVEMIVVIGIIALILAVIAFAATNRVG